MNNEYKYLSKWGHITNNPSDIDIINQSEDIICDKIRTIFSKKPYIVPIDIIMDFALKNLRVFNKQLKFKESIKRVNEQIKDSKEIKKDKNEGIQLSINFDL